MKYRKLTPAELAKRTKPRPMGTLRGPLVSSMRNPTAERKKALELPTRKRGARA